MASIKQRGPNSYLITVSAGRDIYGKKRIETITYKPDPDLTPRKRQKAVEVFAMEFEQKVMNGEAMDGRKITLLEFSERWLAEYAEQRLQGRTMDEYQREPNDRILPRIGHLKLADIHPATVNSFIVSLTKDGARKDSKPGGLARSTIAKTRAVLSSVLQTAVEWELLDRNPCANVRVRTEEAADRIKYVSPEEASAFLQYIENPYKVKIKGHGRTDDTGKPYKVEDYEIEKELPEQLKGIFNLAIFTGLRKGELLAPQWPDVDFEKNQIQVSKAASIVKGEQIVKCPKTKTSHRKVSVPDFLMKRMKELKNSQLRYRLSRGDYWKGEDWVFIQDNGKMMHYGTPAHTFHDTLLRYNEGRPEKEQLPLIPFHGLRHTSATILIASNLDVKTVQQRLGHAEASTTMHIYAHALQETDRKAADALESALRHAKKEIARRIQIGFRGRYFSF